MGRTIQPFFADASSGEACAAEVAASGRATFVSRAVQSDWWAARSTFEALYVARRIAKLPIVLGWGREAGVMVRREAIERQEPLLPSGRRREKKSGLRSWADAAQFDRRVRLVVEQFVECHQREFEELAGRALFGRLVPSPS